jgi:hypothetical protein
MSASPKRGRVIGGGYLDGLQICMESVWDMCPTELCEAEKRCICLNGHDTRNNWDGYA